MSKSKPRKHNPPSVLVSSHQSQLSRILALSVPMIIKTKLIEGILETLKTLVFTQTTSHRNLKQISPEQQQQALWASIESLQTQILEKRKEKQDNESNLDMYFDEIEDMQEVLDMKVEILERAEQKIEAKRNFKEGMTSTIAESMVSDLDI